MGKRIVSEFVSLNGVVEAPGGEPTPSPLRLDDRVHRRRAAPGYKLAEAQEASASCSAASPTRSSRTAWPARTARSPTPSTRCRSHVVSHERSREPLAWSNSTADLGRRRPRDRDAEGANARRRAESRARPCVAGSDPVQPAYVSARTRVPTLGAPTVELEDDDVAPREPDLARAPSSMCSPSVIADGKRDVPERDASEARSGWSTRRRSRRASPSTRTSRRRADVPSTTEDGRATRAVANLPRRGLAPTLGIDRLRTSARGGERGHGVTQPRDLGLEGGNPRLELRRDGGRGPSRSRRPPSRLVSPPPRLGPRRWRYRSSF